ncbi:MAG: hypothetical protein JKY95_04430 [Planctomycetaceae bacterium]|nr:hypothetical protein [Planctomycetaceae bacterium]
MVRIISGEEQLKNLFAGLLENTFHAEMGIVDPHLVDYLTDLLLRFLRNEAIFKLRDQQGHRLEQVSGMLYEAEQSHERPRREIHRHIGDFTLFWSGVYPESLKYLKAIDRKDFLINYRNRASVHTTSQAPMSKSLTRKKLRCFVELARCTICVRKACTKYAKNGNTNTTGKLILKDTKYQPESPVLNLQTFVVLLAGDSYFQE